MTVTMTLAEARVDIGSRLRDFDDDAGGGGRGRRLSLARVTATTTLAEARADVGSTCSRDGDNDGGGGARGHRLSRSSSLTHLTARICTVAARVDVSSRLLARKTAVAAHVDIGSRCVTERTTVPGRHRGLSLAKTTATLMTARDVGARRRERRRCLQGIVVGRLSLTR